MKCLVTNVIVFIRFLVLGKYVKLGNLGFWSERIRDSSWKFIEIFEIAIFKWKILQQCHFRFDEESQSQVWVKNIDQLQSELLLLIYLKSQATLLLKLSCNIQLCPTKAYQVIECSTKTIIKKLLKFEQLKMLPKCPLDQHFWWLTFSKLKH